MAQLRALLQRSPIAGVRGKVSSLLSRLDSLEKEVYQALDRGRHVATQPQSFAQVFCNRELRLDNIDVIGFDYDYTLASYKTQLQELIYNQAKQYLLDELRYPTVLEDKRFDKSFAVRGLYFDRRHGTLTKLSYANNVSPSACFHGRSRLEKAEAQALYPSGMHVSEEYVKQNMRTYVDLFALSEACLMSDVVQLAIDSKIKFDPAALSEDVARAIHHVHTSGKMHAEVAENPAEYVHYLPDLRERLEGCRAAGKKLFLLTNSGLPFVDRGMTFLAGEGWRSLFDAVVVSAQKPSFYQGQAPFRAFDANERFVKWSPAGLETLEKGRVLLGGSVSELARLTGWTGPSVLYIGDHLFSDLLEPRSRLGWTTGAIIRELEQELAVMSSPEYVALDARARVLDGELREAADTWSASSPRPEGLSELLDALESDLRETRVERQKLFNAHFGSVFRMSGGDSTAFAFDVRQHVDVYTSRVENLLSVADGHRFYPQRRGLLPHESRAAAAARGVPESWESHAQSRVDT